MKDGKLQVEASPKEIMRKSGKENLDEAILYFYEKNYEDEGEFDEEKIEVETARKTEYFRNGIWPVIKKDFKLMQRNFM